MDARRAMAPRLSWAHSLPHMGVLPWAASLAPKQAAKELLGAQAAGLSVSTDKASIPPTQPEFPQNQFSRQPRLAGGVSGSSNLQDSEATMCLRPGLPWCLPGRALSGSCLATSEGYHPVGSSFIG